MLLIGSRAILTLRKASREMSGLLSDIADDDEAIYRQKGFVDSSTFYHNRLSKDDQSEVDATRGK